ncbi:triphosphoribosyl-dephospho-CoA synthase [Paraburkholderia sp. BCC1885]|uniref:triphosphoribosyl-dephospho-CoA synthase n=1 Tax=Paraburkholderia sp. BCC1885 TaxID=2562669 RepID=UPI0011824615|nr:triphosphoribosyl-dephospho-CoA synthase [Paraburkholderia sp. BCC1885]
MAAPALMPASAARAASNGAATGLTSGAADARLASFATTALIEEAQLTPKPALVDRRGSGAHRDLDLDIMLRSAQALEPTFAALSRAARHGTPSAILRTELAQIGRAGEQTMLRATGGSNAHRGAIWIVGLLVAGAAICEATAAMPLTPVVPVGRPLTSPASDGASLRSAAAICTVAAQIACFPDRFAASTDSHGERVRQRYQVGGARREAQDGFPHVIAAGLPALLAARTNGAPEDAARLDALLAIMASLDDTCLLHRAGLPGLQAGQDGARRVLALGGSGTVAGRAALAELDRRLLSLNASPGGAADLLAATLFIDMLVHRGTGGSQASWKI